MAWSAPRTWTASEVVTAVMMNAHVRDNLGVLKITRDASARIIEISSATFASLASANLTGLAKEAAANAYTAGRHKLAGTSRLVLPVGADKYEDLGGGLRRGAWVEGDYLHHIASNQTTEWRYLGELLGSPAGAVVGSAWVEGDYLHYIDSSGEERRCQSAGAEGLSPHTDAGAVGGSLWVETYAHWVRESGSLEKPGHGDVAHADGTQHFDSHSDVAHGDSHSDVGHDDSHGDIAHIDFAHIDSHSDTHDDHADGGPENHQDDHGDIHNDFAHLDSHTDSHTDVGHVDSHGDSHTDFHTDHVDHSDAAHADQPTVAP